jgi:hypothetical protein
MILNLNPFGLTLVIVVLISYLIFFLASLSSYPLLKEQEELQMRVTNATPDFKLKLIKASKDARETSDSINDNNSI